MLRKRKQITHKVYITIKQTNIKETKLPGYRAQITLLCKRHNLQVKHKPNFLNKTKYKTQQLQNTLEHTYPSRVTQT